jgi:hypothetical protein
MAWLVGGWGVEERKCVRLSIRQMGGEARRDILELWQRGTETLHMRVVSVRLLR